MSKTTTTRNLHFVFDTKRHEDA